MASEGVMICGSVTSGRDKEGMLGDTISCTPIRSTMLSLQKRMTGTDLFQHVCCQHQNFRVRSEALHRSEIAHSFLEIFGRRHDFQDVKSRP
jgi:hypothetical protein